jgi:CspA family cold shock protein
MESRGDMKQGDDGGFGPGGDAQAATGQLVPLSGTVKWFDMLRGYGFLVPDDGNGDVLMHYSRMDGVQARSLVPGARVSALVREGERGRQAMSLLEIQPGTAEVRPPAAAPEAALADGFEPVQVRWFNRAKGFGFLLCADGFTQAFVHMETVRRAGYGGLEPAQQLAARIESGPRGAVAVELAAVPARD